MSIESTIRRCFCPDGTWQLPKHLESIIDKIVKRLPKEEVSDQERRWPTTQAGLRACLNSFFARHLFQIQATLLEHGVTECILRFIKKRQVRILDVGAGPGVSTLGILEMVNTLAQIEASEIPIIVDNIINDPSELCLSCSKHLLKQYYQKPNDLLEPGKTICVSTPFPKSRTCIERIAHLSGEFDIIVLSYVLVPMFNDATKSSLLDGLQMLAQHVSSGGFLVLVQDQFHENLIKDAGQALGIKVRHHILEQKVYADDNSNDQQYYRFLAATKKK